jgi:uncharacterized protein YggT (Ycf19 family)
MSFINSILDIAGLLLWLSWRSIPFDPVVRATPATLAGTVRRAEPSKLRRWHFLLVLSGLLLVRALFYWGVDWTSSLDFGVVAPSFRGDTLATALLFSLLSFARTWMIFHFWLLALAMINGRSAEGNPLHKLVLLQLGSVGRWPLALQAILPVIVVTAVWMPIQPLLALADVVKHSHSVWRVLGQGALLGGVLFLTLKSILPAFLFVHVISSYVYLGSNRVWDYIGLTSRRMLLPLERLPLRSGRVDFTPVVGIVLILLLLQVLPGVLAAQLARRNLTLWPQ